MEHVEKANQVLNVAKRLSGKTKSWIDFSNQIFNQHDGAIAKAFPNQEERRAFYATEQYGEINNMQLRLMKEHGLTNDVATKSGKFMVRVPKTLHSVLKIEADREGVSLNQLAVAKLSVALHQSTGLSPLLIIKAFGEVHDGYAADRVICDPVLNARYLRRCRGMGLKDSDYELNHALFDIRKTPSKGKLPKTTKKTEFRDYDGYEFASEISVRFLQRQEGASLDSILCDPRLQTKFDELTVRLSPGVDVLKLRYAALNLRKTHRLQPQDAGGPEYDLVSAGPVSRINLDHLPTFAGMYVFYNQERPVFAGETEQLRPRIDRHLQISDRHGLPEWLGGPGAYKLLYTSLPTASRDERLRWLRQFINKEKPLLNYQKVA